MRAFEYVCILVQAAVRLVCVFMAPPSPTQLIKVVAIAVVLPESLRIEVRLTTFPRSFEKLFWRAHAC